MKLLRYDNIPRWYSLFWDTNKAGLYIKIHTFFLEHIEFKNWGPYFADIEERFRWEPLFEKYEPSLGKETFGINDSIVLEHSDGEWFTYRIKIPCVRQFTDRACPKCSATGKRYPEDRDSEEECPYCHESKNESSMVFGEIERVCYSLEIFLKALSMQLGTDVPILEPQLFTIESCSGIGNHSHSVGGYMSPVAVRFLETYSDSYDISDHLPEVEKVMFDAYRQILGEVRYYDESSFRCHVRGGQIIFVCPGNACEIHTDINRKPLDGTGNEITCHNLDTAIQQLTLLSGLAMFSTLFDNQKTI